jgi:hypothetical protein
MDFFRYSRHRIGRTLEVVFEGTSRTTNISPRTQSTWTAPRLEGRGVTDTLLWSHVTIKAVPADSLSAGTAENSGCCRDSELTYVETRLPTRKEHPKSANRMTIQAILNPHLSAGLNYRPTQFREAVERPKIQDAKLLISWCDFKLTKEEQAFGRTSRVQ